MKGIFFFLTITLAAFLGACANTDERPLKQVGAKLERGLKGQGQIVQNDPLQDSFGSDF